MQCQNLTFKLKSCQRLPMTTDSLPMPMVIDDALGHLSGNVLTCGHKLFTSSELRHISSPPHLPMY